MPQNTHAPFDEQDDDAGGAGGRLREAAVEHPGVTALVSLLSSPLALRAGGYALRWARRNPLLAVGLAVGAYVVWNRRRQDAGAYDSPAEAGGGNGAASSADDRSDRSGDAHRAYSGADGATRRRGSPPDATSIASSL